MPYGYIRSPEDKIVFTDGFKEGYALGLKSKINKTTISDAPALPEADEDYKISIAKEAWDAVNTCTPYHPESFVQGYIAKAKTIQEASTKCNECGKLCTPSEMTDDRRMCKDCYIKWLEGQYAELKEINEGYCRNRDRLISIGFPNFKDCKEYAEQLTKAKEIISKLANLDGVINIPMDKVISLRVKAEQFLKETPHD